MKVTIRISLADAQLLLALLQTTKSFSDIAEELKIAIAVVKERLLYGGYCGRCEP